MHCWIYLFTSINSTYIFKYILWFWPLSNRKPSSKYTSLQSWLIFGWKRFSSHMNTSTWPIRFRANNGNGKNWDERLCQTSHLRYMDRRLHMCATPIVYMHLNYVYTGGTIEWAKTLMVNLMFEEDHISIMGFVL